MLGFRMRSNTLVTGLFIDRSSFDMLSSSSAPKCVSNLQRGSQRVSKQLMLLAVSIVTAFSLFVTTNLKVLWRRGVIL